MKDRSVILHETKIHEGLGILMTERVYQWRLDQVKFISIIYEVPRYAELPSKECRKLSGSGPEHAVRSRRAVLGEGGGEGRAG